MAQYKSFKQVEKTIGQELYNLTSYYQVNSLRANPEKTQVTAFHPRNKEAKTSLKVVWNKTELENTTHPKYLGVTLDRSLSYKQHIRNTKMKVATRNNLLTKLATSKWGANPSPIRITALLSYSTAEYAAPVWARSTHAKNLDPELNQACREMSQPSAHRVYLQQSTKEKVEVLHRRHHMSLCKSTRNHGTHVTVLPTRTSLLVG